MLLHCVLYQGLREALETLNIMLKTIRTKDTTIPYLSNYKTTKKRATPQNVITLFLN